MNTVLFNKEKYLILLTTLIFGVLSSSCSDFRQAIGKEKFIPNEYSFLNTPRLVLPPDFGNTDNIIDKGIKKDKQVLTLKNEIKNSNFNELFDFKSIPKNIRQIVDDETLGISRSERTGLDILMGNNPEVGIFLDSEKETIRIKNNKENSLITKPSPSINTIDGNKILIK